MVEHFLKIEVAGQEEDARGGRLGTCEGDACCGCGLIEIKEMQTNTQLINLQNDAIQKIITNKKRNKKLS